MGDRDFPKAGPKTKQFTFIFFLSFWDGEDPCPFKLGASLRGCGFELRLRRPREFRRRAFPSAGALFLKKALDGFPQLQ